MSKPLFLVAFVTGVLLTVTADVVYTPDNTPADTSAIDVDGRAEMVGVDALRHRIAYLDMDDPSDFRKNKGTDRSLNFLNAKGASNKLTIDESTVVALAATGVDTNGVPNVFRGAGSADLNSGGAWVIQPLPTVFQGRCDYSLAMWVKVDAADNVEKPNYGMYSVGNVTNVTGTACLRCTVANSYTSLSAGNWANDAGIPGAKAPTINALEDIRGRWLHLAAVYSYDGATDTGMAKTYVDGVEKATTTYAGGLVFTNAVGALDPNAAVIIGGARYQNYFRQWSAGNMDEVMLFDKALSAEEVKWIKDNSLPYEFSAGWNLNDGSSLCLYGSLGHLIRGYGLVTADWELSLTNDVDAYFGGMIAGGGLVFEPTVSSVTQTLSGVSTFAGKTEVMAGTLLVQPKAEIPIALRPGLIGHWTFDDPKDPGKDLSGSGNTLYPSIDGVFDEPIVSELAGGGRMMRFPFGSTGVNPDGRAVWTTRSWVKGLTNTVTDCGCSVTMAVWARAAEDWGEYNYRTGVVGFENTPGTGIGFNQKAGPVKAVTYGNRDINAGGSYSLSEGAEAAFHMYVLVYDLDLVDQAESNRVARFYLDGELKSTKASYRHGKLNCSGNFQVGGSICSEQRSFAGDIDQVFLFNRALSDEEVASLYAFGCHATPLAATTTLPSTTDLVIAKGATVAFDNANETVRSVSGTGSMEILSTARLTVTDTVGFAGKVTGAGRLALGENLTWTVDSDERGCAKVGTYAYFSVPKAMLELSEADEWTVVPPPRKSAKARVFSVDNGDGTVTFKATVEKMGFVLIYR